MNWRPWDSLTEDEKTVARANSSIKYKTGGSRYVNGIWRGFERLERSEDEMRSVWDKLVARYPYKIEVRPIDFITGD